VRTQARKQCRRRGFHDGDEVAQVVSDLGSARSVLFVPGDRPDRFAKAAACGADAIVIDIEDSVAAARKDEAREHVHAWLASGGTGAVRINSPDTRWFEEDVALVGSHRCTVFLPQASGPDEVADAVGRLPASSQVIALLETAAGVVNAASICRVPRLIRTAFGQVDLSAELGIDPDDRWAHLFSRSTVVLASAAAGLAPPLDGVTTDLGNVERLKADTKHAVALGFTGKLCIHPTQVPLVNDVFKPTHDELDWARRVVDSSANGGATVVGGRMVDKPVVDRAQRILDRYDVLS
jgi:citrate lyase subunit beta/citryl-CoA lyase